VSTLFAEYNNLQNRSINLRMADEVGQLSGQLFDAR